MATIPVYLKDVLARVQDHPRFDELLPWNWKPMKIWRELRDGTLEVHPTLKEVAAMISENPNSSRK